MSDSTIVNVLVVGAGGREHALAWKLAASKRAGKIYVAPGNAGTELDQRLENIDIAADNITALIAFAKDKQIGLTVIGPEAPLVAGIVDAFQAAGLACYGPDEKAAILEGSKAYSKDFLKRHQIPTASYETFTEVQSAIDYARAQAYPLVIKADGLAAGKGVIIAQDETEAVAAVSDMLAGNKFGEAGHRVVIEEFLTGEEASFIVMCDGEHYLPLASSQDHKARDEDDQGPNTGGMGAYSPAPVVTAEIHDRILKQVIEPTLNGMKKDGRRYCGFLYAGLMIDEHGQSKVLEFNCRFGDPETQPVMMRLNSDFLELCLAAVKGQLNTIDISWDERVALGVVLAARGYPESPGKGDVIHGADMQLDENEMVFHAGTSVDEQQQLLTAGGRVLCVTALADSVADARQKVYARIKQISWDGMFYRSDIGYRAIDRK